MRVRLPFVPALPDRRALRVLVSYRSTEVMRARAFADRLEHLGFSIVLLPPGSLGEKSKRELAAALAPVVDAADMCCVMTSEAAANSEWVRFEYQEAAAACGRAIFVLSTRSGGLFDFDTLTAYSRPRGASLVVKHTALDERIPDDDLLVELCNDQLEGWFDGTESYPRPDSRDLRAESEIRNFVRRCAMTDPRYHDRTIVDVLPFSWNWSPTRDYDEVFRWLLNARGRGDLLAALSNGEVDGFVARYWVTRESTVTSFLGDEDGNEAFGLLFTRPHRVERLDRSEPCEPQNDSSRREHG